MLKKYFSFVVVFLISLFYSARLLHAAAPDCAQSLSTLSGFTRCETSTSKSFLTYQYACQDGIIQTIDTGRCQDFSAMLTQVKKSCQSKCIGDVVVIAPSPSIRPTTVPIPTTTPLPSPQYTTAPSPSPVALPSILPSPTIMPTSIPSPVSSIRPSAPPLCKAQELVSHQFSQECGAENGVKQYKYIEYKCGNGLSGKVGSSSSCQYYTSLMDAAWYYCRKNTCETQASPVASISPKPTPTLSSYVPLSCRMSCIFTRSSQSRQSCLNNCLKRMYKR